MRKCSLLTILIAISLNVLTSLSFADTLIYDNSILEGGYIPTDYNYNEKFLDYGSSPGGLVSKFEIGYAAKDSYPGVLFVGFFQGTTRSQRGTYFKNITITDLDGPSNPDGTAYAFFREYIIPEEERFELPSGNFGYSFEFWNDQSGPLLASGGLSNENYYWHYYINTWYGSKQIIGGYSGFYMKIYTAPPLNEVTCDIRGHKFDDADADGIWDIDELGLAGWEIYIDTNNNDQFDPGVDPNIMTDPNGMYFFENLDAPATYTLREVMKNGRTQTLPGGPDYEYTIVAEPNNVYNSCDFGNTTQTILDYCDAWGDCERRIESVQLKAINTTDTGCADGYADYTSLSTTLDTGNKYVITVIPSYSIMGTSAECTVWVDWNQDFDFDDPDEILEMDSSTNNDPCRELLSVPEDALLGDTRMRVRLHKSTLDNPCGFMPDGEVEDYTITVVNEDCSAPQYGGGCGTEQEPYLIYTAEHMQAIGATPWDWDKHFKLMNDIDLSGYTDDSFNTIGYYIPFSVQVPFTGVFDGNDHTISNFTYYSADKSDMGLFGLVRDENALIKNLTLTDPNLYVESGSDLGLLVGWLDEGTVSDCHIINGNISGVGSIGGLVGLLGDLSGSPASVLNCSSTARVSRGVFIGGLVGKGDYSAEISNSYSISNVSGEQSIGGLVGFGRAPMMNCYAKGSVLGTSTDIGGLVGLSQNTTIDNCYSTAYVEGSGNIGGFVGWNLNSTFSDCFWDTETSNQSSGVGSGTSDGITEKTTDEMIQQTTYTNWDFETVWRICDEMNYPRLQWQPIPLGDFVCPEGVEIYDLLILTDEWLAEAIDLPADISPENGDGKVNLSDWFPFAAAWRSSDGQPDWNQACDLWSDGIIDTADIQVFAEQWLMRSAHHADIAPLGSPDQKVDWLDYCVFVENWQTGTD